MIELSPYEYWQLQTYGNIVSTCDSEFSQTEDELRQDI